MGSLVDLEMETTKAQSRFADVRSFYDICGYTGPVNPDDDMIIAFSKSEIVGVVRLVNEHNVPILRGMNIREDFQRQGIGSRMLKAFDRLIVAKKLQPVYLICGTHLESYYGQVLFKKVESFQLIPAFLVERMKGYQVNVWPTNYNATKLHIVIRREPIYASLQYIDFDAKYTHFYFMPIKPTPCTFCD